jgi:hypothetical protein
LMSLFERVKAETFWERAVSLVTFRARSRCS